MSRACEAGGGFEAATAWTARVRALGAFHPLSSTPLMKIMGVK